MVPGRGAAGQLHRPRCEAALGPTLVHQRKEGEAAVLVEVVVVVEVMVGVVTEVASIHTDGCP